MKRDIYLISVSTGKAIISSDNEYIPAAILIPNVSVPGDESCGENHTPLVFPFCTISRFIPIYTKRRLSRRRRPRMSASSQRTYWFNTSLTIARRTISRNSDDKMIEGLCPYSVATPRLFHIQRTNVSKRARVCTILSTCSLKPIFQRTVQPRIRVAKFRREVLCGRAVNERLSRR